jgi:hypothetical protein
LTFFHTFSPHLFNYPLLYVYDNLFFLLLYFNDLYILMFFQSILSGMQLKKPQGVDYLSEERIAESLKFLDELEDILSYQMAPLTGAGGGIGCGLNDGDGQKVSDRNSGNSAYVGEGGGGVEEEMTYEEVLNLSRFPCNLLVPPNVDYTAVGGVRVGRRHRRESDLVATRRERERMSRQTEGDRVGDEGYRVRTGKGAERGREGGREGGESSSAHCKSDESSGAEVKQGSAESTQDGTGRGRGRGQGQGVDVSRIDLVDKARRSEVRLGNANTAHNVRQ